MGAKFLPRLLFIFAVTLLSPAGMAASETLYPGPIYGEVKRVIDGDTLVVDAYIWPNTQASDVAIRVRGIDTPERRGKCQRERELAEQAKRLMIAAFPPGHRVSVFQVEPGKYGGRFVAAVQGEEGLDWATHIQSLGLAAPYFGRGAKRDWCSDPNLQSK